MKAKPFLKKLWKWTKRIFIFLFFANRGSVFFTQPRPGKGEKIFKVIKFKTMNDRKDQHGNLLPDKDRLTTVGKFIRSASVDELPQLINVLKGDMAIVGYRPERKHFIEEITKKTPQYKRLFSHKPGITSLGQVHYGYAENVDQMCERLRFDLLYFCDINLNSDVSIILKTVKVMVQGKGK